MDYLNRYFSQKTIDYSRNYPFENKEYNDDVFHALNENDIFSMLNVGCYFYLKKEENKFVHECGVGWFFKIIDAYEKGNYKKFIYCGIDDSLNIYLNAKYLLSTFLLPHPGNPTEHIDNITNENYQLGMKYLEDCATDEFWDCGFTYEELFYRYSIGCGVDPDEEKAFHYALKSLLNTESKNSIDEFNKFLSNTPTPEA